MQIQWLGHSSFKIQAKTAEQEVTLITDPFSDSAKLKMPKIQADIVTISHQHDGHQNIDAIKGEPFVIHTPGEYEYKDVLIYGIPTFHDKNNGKENGKNTIYHFNAEGINIVHLGDLGHELNDEQIEKINSVDILLIPVGGVHALDTAQSTSIISTLEPRIVIPMHFDGENDKKGGLEAFIKDCGLPMEKIDKLKIFKKDLPQDKTKLVILNS